MKNTIIVDFSGLAGSGKTYVCKRICENLKIQGIIVKTLGDMRINPVWLIVAGLPVLFKTVFFVLRCKPVSWTCAKSAAMSWFKMQMKILYFRKQGGVALIDEGYLHMFRKIRRCSGRNIVLRDVYLPIFIEPDLTVITEAEPEAIASRRASRDGLILDDQQSRDAVARMHLTYCDANFLAMQSRDYAFCVVINSTDNNLESEIDNVVDLIVQRLVPGGE